MFVLFFDAIQFDGKEVAIGIEFRFYTFRVHVEKYPNFFPWNDNFCLEFCHKLIWRKHQIVWVHELFFREMTRLVWNFDFDTNQFDE